MESWVTHMASSGTLGLDKKGLQIFKCLSKFVDLRLQRQTKFVEPLIAWRPDGQNLSAHDLLVVKGCTEKLADTKQIIIFGCEVQEDSGCCKVV